MPLFYTFNLDFALSLCGVALKGILMVLMFALAYGLLFVIYGKEGLELRKEQGKKIAGPLAVLVFMLFCWLLCVMFLFAGFTGEETILDISIAVAVPAIIAIWTVIARKTLKKHFRRKRTRV